MCETELNKPCYIDFWQEGIFSECPYDYEDCRECEKYRQDDDLK